MRKVLLAMVPVCGLSGTAHAQILPGSDLSNESLIKQCDQKTLVYNAKGDLVGKKIDPFCAGYLTGAFHALINMPNTKCTSSLVNDQTPDSLLSIFLTYQKDKVVSVTSAASPTALAAYQRAFNCGPA